MVSWLLFKGRRRGASAKQIPGRRHLFPTAGSSPSPGGRKEEQGHGPKVPSRVLGPPRSLLDRIARGSFRRAGRWCSGSEPTQRNPGGEFSGPRLRGHLLARRDAAWPAQGSAAKFRQGCGERGGVLLETAVHRSPFTTLPPTPETLVSPERS